MSRSKENLEPREEAFCQAFACIESESYGHGTDSAKAAGYAEKSARTQAWKLRKRPEVQARIAELYDTNLEKHSGKIISDLEHHRLLALKKNDIASANKASELQGKAIAGMFYERSAPQESSEQHELSEEQQALLEDYKAYRKRMLLRPEGGQQGTLSPQTGTLA